jgi:hypothetical protein
VQTDWILDVLADLKTFAMSNGLPVLAEQLDDTALVAMAEIAAREEKDAGERFRTPDGVRKDTGIAGASGGA